MNRTIALGLLLCFSAAAHATQYTIAYQAVGASDGGTTSLTASSQTLVYRDGDLISLDQDGNPTNLTNGAYGAITAAVASEGGAIAFFSAAGIYAPSGPGAWSLVGPAGYVVSPGGVNDSGSVIYTQFAGSNLFRWNGISNDVIPTPNAATFWDAVQNNSGQFAVKAESGSYGLFLWNGLGYTDLSLYPAHAGFDTGLGGLAINSLGHMVWLGGQSGVGVHLFYWDGSTVRDLSAEFGVNDVHPPAMNDLDQIAFTAGNIEHKLYSITNGQLNYIGSAGGSGLSGVDINALGQISFNDEGGAFTLAVPEVPGPPELNFGLSAAGSMTFFDETPGQDVFLLVPLAPSINAVPEPATWLLVSCASSIAFAARRHLRPSRPMRAPAL